MTPGKETSEYKLSVITNLIAAVMALALAYGLLTAEQAELWTAVILAVMAVVVPLAMALVTREYTMGRTALKLEAMQPGAAIAKPEAAE